MGASTLHTTLTLPGTHLRQHRRLVRPTARCHPRFNSARATLSHGQRPASPSPTPPRDGFGQAVALGPDLAVPAAAGSLFGAIALITGSSVGAGMLALPAVTADAGLAPSCAALCATWAVLTLEALLMAEVNLAVRDPATDSPTTIITLRQMAERTLGSAGKAVTVIYLLLSYSLLVAYLSKASEVLDYFVGHALPPAATAALLVGSMATLMIAGGADATDRVNQALTSVLLAAFLGILVAGGAQADVGAAMFHGHGQWDALAGATPIMFLSLVYHDLVPFLCQYLGGDRPKIRTALILGSAVPLAMFLSWEAVALGLLPTELITAGSTAALQVALPFTGVAAGVGEVEGVVNAVTALGGDGALTVVATAVSSSGDGVARLAVDPLEVFVRRSGPVVGTGVQSFSFLAVMTSFIGTTLGLSETLRSEIPPLLQEVGRRADAVTCAVTFDEGDLGNTSPGSTSRSGRGTQTGSAGLTLRQRLVSAVTGSFDDGSPAASCLASHTLLDDARTLRDGARTTSSGEEDTSRAVALLLCLLPPLAFTAYNPGSFLAVLSVAGGYGMTLLYGLLPPMMAWKLRSKQEESVLKAMTPPSGGRKSFITTAAAEGDWMGPQPFVPGGRPVLAGLFATAAAVEIGRLATDAGIGLGSATPAAHAVVNSLVETAASAATLL